MGEGMAVVERFYACFQKNDWTGARACYAPECKTIMPGGPPLDNDQHEQMGRAFKTAFPDGHMEIRHAVEGGEWIAVEGDFVGKHDKDLVGAQGTIPTKGKSLRMRFADFFHVRGGKIAEHRVYFDQADMLAQLGAMPGK